MIASKYTLMVENEKATSYDDNDYQLIVRADGAFAYGAKSSQMAGLKYAVTTDNQGYTVKIAVPHSVLGGSPGLESKIGFDIGINDDDDGGERDGQLMWHGPLRTGEIRLLLVNLSTKNTFSQKGYRFPKRHHFPSLWTVVTVNGKRFPAARFPSKKQ